MSLEMRFPRVAGWSMALHFNMLTPILAVNEVAGPYSNRNNGYAALLFYHG
jgi:hypothetical protein